MTLQPGQMLSHYRLVEALGRSATGRAALLAGLIVATPLLAAAESSQSEREAMYRRYLEFASYVKGGSVEPHWMTDGSTFWYAEGTRPSSVVWKVDPKANTKTRLSEAPEEQTSRPIAREGEVASPDGRWSVTTKEHNLWLRSGSDDHRSPLTDDGIADFSWMVPSWGDLGWWSPDGLKLAAKKKDTRQVAMMPIVHWLGLSQEVAWRYYPPPGAPVARIELYVLDVPTGKPVLIDVWPEQEIYILGWRPDGAELFFVRSDQEFKRFELVAADPTSGAKRVVLSETRETFVNGWNFSRTSILTFLDNGRRFIWMSERDGWNHLYLFDMQGNLIRQLTRGESPVVEVAGVDEKAGWVYFTAHGDDSRPYDTHLYRVNLEGEDLVPLTEAPGQHAIQLAPSKEFFLDTHSSVERPPSVDLRRTDGTLLQTLSRANVERLEGLRWQPPEEFAVKAADEKTDLYGVLYRPFDFNPDQKYPVIQVVYGGARVAQGVRRTFVPRLHDQWAHELAQLGFITFFVDPRGTAHRGKEFQDVFYGNVGSPEKIADYVGTLKQLAKKRPYMDLDRVGIMGHSAGGYYALRALLLEPDVYRVGVASAAPADGSVIPWVFYMGLPQNNQEGYDLASNLPLAGNLEGKLLLTVGTSDPLFSWTLQMVDALIGANKQFDLVLLPEKGHSLPRESPYWREAIRRYFQEHLKP